MKTLYRIINTVCSVLVILLITVLSIDNWSIVLVSITDIKIVNAANKVFDFKIWSAIALVAIILSHVFFYQIMYDSTISSKIISWVNQHSTNWAIWLTLGYINTYLLDLFYIKYKYTQYKLLQYRVNVMLSTITMFPILNMVVYCLMFKEMRKNVSLPPAKDLIVLYLKGQLMTYLIRIKGFNPENSFKHSSF